MAKRAKQPAGTAPPPSGMVNLTPALEAVLGIGTINSREDLDRLIAALRAMPDGDLFDAAHLAEISARLQAEIKKDSRKED
ncbi:MAG: hypothetical protein H6Q33_345 [Deltaproteobacteria bacterium]|nr:hypothetical protein [Deltaproteobacteria bacterium]